MPRETLRKLSETLQLICWGGAILTCGSISIPTKEDELQFLQQNLKIHDPTMEDIVYQNQRPKLDSVDDYVYLAVHPLQITMHQR